MRRFYLHRDTDASGVSGLGNVAEGCQHDNEWCSLVWLTLRDAGGDVMAYYKNIERIEEIHGHGGMTKVVWIDDESSNVCVKNDDVSQPTKYMTEQLKKFDEMGVPNCDCHGIKR